MDGPYHRFFFYPFFDLDFTRLFTCFSKSTRLGVTCFWVFEKVPVLILHVFNYFQKVLVYGFTRFSEKNSRCYPFSWIFSSNCTCLRLNRFITLVKYSFCIRLFECDWKKPHKKSIPPPKKVFFFFRH